jgi:hypothetical protein
MYVGFDKEMEEEVRIRKAHCYKLMLEAGADVSLPTIDNHGPSISSFTRALVMRSSVNMTLLSKFNIR